ncbi:hypothetical protein BDB00DRAFT_807797 [Zychaea mexicana]|uniref:uncharacterized protein n=1 Tax=Zychaea mexicana TaxID=64656 RepID=UPI0022FF3F46|nr:uncharacterized protein BDB00DRAFT_807797 [Zychaea mexicana]KAI9496919.1 hypothetical protein BDB00DRAFT_807797 [Zychaea mexicana]
MAIDTRYYKYIHTIYLFINTTLIRLFLHVSFSNNTTHFVQYMLLPSLSLPPPTLQPHQNHRKKKHKNAKEVDLLLFFSSGIKCLYFPLPLPTVTNGLNW